MNEFKHPVKFYDNVAYYLGDPREQDSLVLQNMINQIDPLIPQIVYYASSKEEANFIIEIQALQEDSTLYINSNPKVVNRNGYYNNEIVSQHYILKSRENRRLPSIRSKVLQGLVSLNGVVSTGRDLYKNISKGSILLVDGRISEIFADDLDFELSELDKFIPFLIAQIIFLILGLKYLMKPPRHYLLINSFLLLAICSIFTIGSFFSI